MVLFESAVHTLQRFTHRTPVARCIPLPKRIRIKHLGQSRGRECYPIGSAFKLEREKWRPSLPRTPLAEHLAGEKSFPAGLLRAALPFLRGSPPATPPRFEDWPCPTAFATGTTKPQAKTMERILKASIKQTVVNKRTFRGVAIPIGRPTIFGNPFSHLSHSRAEIVVSDRYTAIMRYASWVVTGKDPQLKRPPTSIHEAIRRGELDKPLTLMCFCAPLACHGDVLDEIRTPEKLTAAVADPQDFLRMISLRIKSKY